MKSKLLLLTAMGLNLFYLTGCAPSKFDSASSSSLSHASDKEVSISEQPAEVIKSEVQSEPCEYEDAAVFCSGDTGNVGYPAINYMSYALDLKLVNCKNGKQSVIYTLSKTKGDSISVKTASLPIVAKPESLPGLEALSSDRKNAAMVYSYDNTGTVYPKGVNAKAAISFGQNLRFQVPFSDSPDFTVIEEVIFFYVKCETGIEKF